LTMAMGTRLYMLTLARLELVADKVFIRAVILVLPVVQDDLQAPICTLKFAIWVVLSIHGLYFLLHEILMMGSQL